MTLMSSVAAGTAAPDDPRSWAIGLLRGYLAGRTGTGVELDVGVLGLPESGPTADPRPAGELVYPVRLYGQTVLLGPLHRADGGSRPCGRCLDRRWLALRPVEERRAIEDGTDFSVCGNDPFLVPFVLEQIARIVSAETAGAHV